MTSCRGTTDGTPDAGTAVTGAVQQLPVAALRHAPCRDLLHQRPPDRLGVVAAEAQDVDARRPGFPDERGRAAPRRHQLEARAGRLARYRLHEAPQVRLAATGHPGIEEQRVQSDCGQAHP
jgi:hypothetical protein